MAKNREGTPKYEDVKRRMLGNLERTEEFFYASMMRKGRGEEGQRDGLYASLYGLREKVGLEGILGVLESQGEESIRSGNGLNSEFSLSKVIQSNTQNFLESLGKLKPEDIASYIGSRLAGVKIEIKSDKQLKELAKKEASKEDKDYAAYLITQVQNAVMAKVAPIVYSEKARRINEAYLTNQPES